jgi:hypothetical protein
MGAALNMKVVMIAYGFLKNRCEKLVVNAKSLTLMGLLRRNKN